MAGWQAMACEMQGVMLDNQKGLSNMEMYEFMITLLLD